MVIGLSFIIRNIPIVNLVGVNYWNPITVVGESCITHAHILVLLDNKSILSLSVVTIYGYHLLYLHSGSLIMISPRNVHPLRSSNIYGKFYYKKTL